MRLRHCIAANLGRDRAEWDVESFLANIGVEPALCVIRVENGEGKNVRRQ